jgi:Sua5/YciO/YrdC/YwlC family protein
MMAMAQYFSVHSANPQPRLLRQAAQLLREGGLVALPTDSSYAVVAPLDDKAAADALRRLRGLDERHHLTVLCRDLAEIAQFARVDNAQYRLLKAATPGPWTFILEATREVPRRVSHPSRKTIGIRVPDHPVALALLELASGAVMSTTLIPEGETLPLNDPEEIRRRYQHELAAVIDAGACSLDPTTVLDLTTDPVQVLRVGKGDPARLGLQP